MTDERVIKIQSQSGRNRIRLKGTKDGLEVCFLTRGRGWAPIDCVSWNELERIRAVGPTDD